MRSPAVYNAATLATWEIFALESSPHIERIMALTAFVSLGPALTKRVAEVFIDVSRKEKALAGRVLMSVGDSAVQDGIVLLSGEISVIKQGSPEIIAEAPELIGEMAQISPTRQRTATVTAHTDITLLHFTWRDFANEARRRLTEEEFKKLSTALQDHAWRHTAD